QRKKPCRFSYELDHARKYLEVIAHHRLDSRSLLQDQPTKRFLIDWFAGVVKVSNKTLAIVERKILAVVSLLGQRDSLICQHRLKCGEVERFRVGDNPVAVKNDRL